MIRAHQRAESGCLGRPRAPENHELGDGSVDDPGGAHEQRIGEAVDRADAEDPERQDDGLGAGGDAERVGAGHPGAVGDRSPALDREDAEHDARHHGRAEGQPDDQ